MIGHKKMRPFLVSDDPAVWKQAIQGCRLRIDRTLALAGVGAKQPLHLDGRP